MIKFLAAFALVGLMSVPAFANPWTVTATTEVAATSTSASTQELGEQTRAVRMTLTSHTGWVGFSNGVVGALSVYMPNGDPQIFKVQAGVVISVRLGAGAGVLYIEELSR